jgi:hypothetical protein
MQLYASKHIRFLYIITFLDSLLKGLQGFPTLKQIVSLNIGLKSIISDYNQGHIIRELRTREPFIPPHFSINIKCMCHDTFGPGLIEIESLFD